MQNVNSIINCPNCTRKLRVPEDRGRLNVSCPDCSYYFWWEPGVLGEIAELDFRCTETARQFSVLFLRQRTDAKFRIRELGRFLPHSRTALKDRVQSRLDSVGSRNSNDYSSKIVPFAKERRSFPAEEFDFSGWRCCECGAGGDTGTMFIRCGTCKELVCSHHVIKLNNGISTFRCSPVCTGRGELSGEIEEYGANAVSLKERKPAITQNLFPQLARTSNVTTLSNPISTTISHNNNSWGRKSNGW